MAVTHTDSITLVAGEELEPFRRVKYHTSAGQVVYADAADENNWIGVTEPGPDGDAIASGGQVSVVLRGGHKTLKMEAGAAVTANAWLYPEDDGKVSDDAGSTVIGQAAGADTASGDGSVVECHPVPHGPELLVIATASAVNEMTLTRAATAGAPALKASGGDTNVSQELGGKGSGVVQVTSPLVDKATQTAKIATATLTIAELLTKIIDGTPTGAATYTLPTAALLVAGIIDCKVGDSFEFLVNNKSSGANTITVAAGSGGTADGTLTVAQNVIRAFRIIVTNVTGSSEAYFAYGIGA
ncbi:MAG: hypothetical protein KAY37_01000 [Phycisphaerae bacterium]|nr:hypothetical protein [Phycisphaerae bacterium]